MVVSRHPHAVVHCHPAFHFPDLPLCQVPKQDGTRTDPSRGLLDQPYCISPDIRDRFVSNHAATLLPASGQVARFLRRLRSATFSPMERPYGIGTLETALLAAECGYSCIPVWEGTKIPAVAWKGWQRERPTSEMYERWFRETRHGIAILTTGMVVFDCDDPALEELVVAECGDTPHRLQTPRGGIHLGYRKRSGVEVHNRVRIRGKPLDIRTDGGLEVIPPSATERGAYKWLGEGLIPLSQLPTAAVEWTRDHSRKRTVRCLKKVCDADVMVRRARGYLASIEGAISGRRGHDKTFRVACVLAHKFGLSFEQAWPLFLEWNEQCEPPWSEAELTHKLVDALSKRR
jgi:hypothetical protein